LGTDQLREFGIKHSNSKLISLAQLLSKIPDRDTSSYLRRPLLIRMLLNLDFGNTGSNTNQNDFLALGRIYEKYFETTLSVDYDLNKSHITANLKQSILSNIAFDIFSGVDSTLENQIALSVGFNRVSERVMEFVSRDPDLRPLLDGRNERDYNWTNDFLGTSNHVLEKVHTSSMYGLADNNYFQFAHQSFYEYFVGCMIIKKIEEGNLGLEFNSLSLAVNNSLVLAFVKELGGVKLYGNIKRFLIRPRINNEDRLILYYLLEDDPDFGTEIERSPSQYFDFIKQKCSEDASFFLKKVMRYQLVIKGEYPAIEYVNAIERNEDEKSLLVEERLHGAEISVTKRLLQRLDNPTLWRAKYITIYRLGQLGDESAISSLQKISPTENSLYTIARESIEKINNRIINS
jgi:hypothetical protein